MLNIASMITDTGAPRIAITTGEPAGIGPDIVIHAAQHEYPAELVALSDPEILQQRAALLNLRLELVPFQPSRYNLHRPGRLTILPVRHDFHGSTGLPNTADAGYVLRLLTTACDKCLDGTFDALVTAPVHKGIINDAGYSFTGHTEFLADQCRVTDPVMMLMDNSLKIALLTTHLPLDRVSSHLTGEKLEKVIRIIHADLQSRFAIPEPAILVCGLNPHAGEGGHLGRQEIDIMIPVLNKLRQEGIHLTGPLPADTAFTSSNRGNHDLILTMYHDQGLPVLKSQGFGEIVNITLGLPIIRTSVDHGTALELAGTGKASCTSMVTAITSAIALCQQNSINKNIRFKNSAVQ